MIDIVEEHFEELDFLWELREGVIFAPDWTLANLAELELRAKAHLAGLRVGELHAVDCARPALSGDQKFAATASTFVFMEADDPDLRAEVVKALGESDALARDGIRIGLRHSRIDTLREGLLAFAGSDDLVRAAAAADVLAFHRIEVGGLARLLEAEEPRVRILGCGAAGRSRLLGMQDALLSLASDRCAAVRSAALHGAALLGTKQLAEQCRAHGGRGGDAAAESLAFLGVVGDASDLPLLERAARSEPGLARAALSGLGALGNIAAVPVILDLMEADDELAPDAAAALRCLVGELDLERDAKGAEPIDDEDGLANDAGSVVDRPDPAKARAWWRTARESLAPSARWQAGLDVAAPATIVRELPLARRRDLLLRMRVASMGGVAIPELEARVDVQLRA